LKLSVIIPVFNSEKTITACLGAISLSSNKPLEVLVVNDGSTDQSRELAAKFKCKIVDLDKNQGRANARNVGASQATGDVLIFIDADIVIPPDALIKVMEIFRSKENVMVVNGILAAEVGGLNFCSDYKNLYMNYNFKSMPDHVDFIFSSFVAIKKEFFLPFKDYKATDDTELGMRMAQTHNKKIFLAKDIEVSHLKLYTFFGLLQNDFKVARDWAALLLQNRSIKNIVAEKRFAHASFNQLLSLFFVGIVVLSLAATPFIPHTGVLACLVSVLLAVGIRTDYFRFIYQKRGLVFLLRSIGLFLIDSLAHIAGILAGLLFPQTPKEV